MDFDKKISFKLPDDAFKRIDEQPDENFYKIPRFVAHIDFGAIDAVTELTYMGPTIEVLCNPAACPAALPRKTSDDDRPNERRTTDTITLTNVYATRLDQDDLVR